MTIKIDYEYGIPLCGPRPAKGAPLLKKWRVIERVQKFLVLAILWKKKLNNVLGQLVKCIQKFSLKKQENKQTYN